MSPLLAQSGHERFRIAAVQTGRSTPFRQSQIPAVIAAILCQAVSRMPQNQSSQEPSDRQGSGSDAAGWIMLGDLIANLDRPDVTAAVLTTLDPIVATRIEQHAGAAAMAVADFAARAVRDFVEHADDERWFQLLTIIRKADNPGVAAIQAILGWVAADASFAPTR